MSTGSEFIKVRANYVLVEQTMHKKKSVILHDAAKNEADKFDITYKIIQVGPECKSDISVGGFPIFGKFAEPQAVKVISKDANSMIALGIYHENDIIAFDYENAKHTSLN